MKNLLLLALLVMGAVALSGCNSAPAEPEKKTTVGETEDTGRGEKAATSEMTPGPAANENRVGTANGGN